MTEYEHKFNGKHNILKVNHFRKPFCGAELWNKNWCEGMIIMCKCHCASVNIKTIDETDPNDNIAQYFQMWKT